MWELALDSASQCSSGVYSPSFSVVVASPLSDLDTILVLLDGNQALEMLKLARASLFFSPLQ